MLSKLQLDCRTNGSSLLYGGIACPNSVNKLYVHRREIVMSSADIAVKRTFGSSQPMHNRKWGRMLQTWMRLAVSWNPRKCSPQTKFPFVLALFIVPCGLLQDCYVLHDSNTLSCWRQGGNKWGKCDRSWVCQSDANAMHVVRKRNGEEGWSAEEHDGIRRASEPGYSITINIGRTDSDQRSTTFHRWTMSRRHTTSPLTLVLSSLSTFHIASYPIVVSLPCTSTYSTPSRTQLCLAKRRFGQDGKHIQGKKQKKC